MYWLGVGAKWKSTGIALLLSACAAAAVTAQLLLPMALAGAGSFTSVKVNLHARTNMDVIAKFLSVRFETNVSEEFTRSEVIS